MAMCKRIHVCVYVRGVGKISNSVPRKQLKKIFFNVAVFHLLYNTAKHTAKLSSLLQQNMLESQVNEAERLWFGDLCNYSRKNLEDLMNVTGGKN